MIFLVLLAVAALPVVAVVLLVGVRSPRRVLVPLYAAVVPFGSSIALPLPLPAPFNTVTTLLGLACAAALGAELVFLRRGAPRILPEAFAWIGFAGVAALTFVWSTRPAVTVDALFVLLSLLVLYVLYALVRLDEGDVERFERGAVAGGVITCVWGLVLLVTGNLPEENAGLPRFAISGGVGDAADPNITAAVLVLPLVIAVGIALRSGRGRQRVLATGSALLISAGILLTASRGGVVAAAIGTFVVIAQGRRRSLSLAIAAVGVIGVIAFLSLSAPEQVDRLTAPGSSGRTNIWRTGLVACEQHCALGSGLATFPQVQEETLLTTPGLKGFRLREQPHNMWLGAAVETGIASIILIVLAFALTFRTLVRSDPLRRAPALGAVIGLLVSNAFLANLRFKYFWVVLMYAAAVGLAHARRPAPPIDATPQVRVGAGAV